MKTIWKAHLRPIFRQTVEMPKGAKLLHVGKQGEEMFVWFMCDPKAETEMRAFEVCGTGHDIPADFTYVGTVVTYEGTLVWHIFADRI